MASINNQTTQHRKHKHKNKNKNNYINKNDKKQKKKLMHLQQFSDNWDTNDADFKLIQSEFRLDHKDDPVIEGSSTPELSYAQMKQNLEQKAQERSLLVFQKVNEAALRQAKQQQQPQQKFRQVNELTKTPCLVHNAASVSQEEVFSLRSCTPTRSSPWSTFCHHPIQQQLLFKHEFYNTIEMKLRKTIKSKIITNKATVATELSHFTSVCSNGTCPWADLCLQLPKSKFHLLIFLDNNRITNFCFLECICTFADLNKVTNNTNTNNIHRSCTYTPGKFQPKMEAFFDHSNHNSEHKQSKQERDKDDDNDNDNDNDSDSGDSSDSDDYILIDL